MNNHIIRELNRRYGSTGITSFALHPGVIPTGIVTAVIVFCTLIFDSAELGRYSTMAGFFYKVGGLFMKSIAQGAATQVDKFTKSCH